MFRLKVLPKRDFILESFIGLFSTPHAVEFYKKFTLEKRDLVGLFTVKELIVSQ